MEVDNQQKYETTINCGSCIAKVKPSLDELVGEGNWEVDTSDSKKILSIHADFDEEQTLILKLAELGYAANKI
ncbi:MAG: hypothetical protein WED33_13310 [Bacteroidia bacterium]